MKHGVVSGFIWGFVAGMLFSFFVEAIFEQSALELLCQRDCEYRGFSYGEFEKKPTVHCICFNRLIEGEELPLESAP